MKKDEEVRVPHGGRPVVRLFSGYADSPIWAASGPVDYADSALTEELVADLTTWDSGSYGGVDGLLLESSERSEALAEELAGRLAAELGDGFVVSCDGAAGPKIVTSDMPPTNPDAAAAFTELIDEELKLRDNMYYYASLSGQVFTGPDKHRDSRGPGPSP
ncbi:MULTISPECIES: hypothetical protein [unclassified Arthrobacter]|uniref:hypothetical protein n=1 Tax=unclassified Arthrobacter TaxID=235627 RepID=UPI001491E0B0|nr:MULTISPECIES: hypothetical protein [unclassified Arthrobacter]NOJ64122.1 hypothetical protein [Arthrobacter sp. 147(2020)]